MGLDDSLGFMKIKTQDGAAYTLTWRTEVMAGQLAYRWMDDSGREIELTDEEAAVSSGKDSALWWQRFKLFRRCEQ